MKPTEKQIWFPAKKYGWGWGPPRAWQGWAVLAGFAVSLSAAGFLLLPGNHIGLWIASVIALAMSLFAICLAKGETPRWRWGESDQPAPRPSTDRLTELDELHRRQLISDSEYQAKRQEILKNL